MNQAWMLIRKKKSQKHQAHRGVQKLFGKYQAWMLKGLCIMMSQYPSIPTIPQKLRSKL